MATNAPLTEAQMLYEEYVSLEPTWKERLDEVRPQVPHDDPSRRAEANEDLKRLLGAVHELQATRRLAALCLSGGGIRSATFNLGVLQGLAERGVLGLCDYLSSVSGGGYVASWFVGWVHRERLARSPKTGSTAPGPPVVAFAPKQTAEERARAQSPEALALRAVTEQIKSPLRNPSAPEPEPIRHLRSYSNYLTPRLGLMSVDTWTTVVIVARNLLLNWLVLVPLLAAVLTLPLLAVATWQDAGSASSGFVWALGFAGAGLMLMTALRGAPRSWRMAAPVALLLLLIGTALLGLAVYQWRPAPEMFEDGLGPAFVWAFVMPLAAFVLSLGVQRALFNPPRAVFVDAFALAVAGLVETAIFAALAANVLGPLRESVELFAMLAPTLILGPLLLGKTVFVAVASLAEQWKKSGLCRDSEYGDAQREWWARWSAWILIVLVAWTAVSAIAYYSPWALQTGWAQLVTFVGGPALGSAIALLGKSASTSGPAAQTDDRDKPKSPWTDRLMTLGVPLFCVLLLAAIAWGSQRLLGTVIGGERPPGASGPLIATPWEIVAAVVTLFGLGILMATFVNVNRFSLQALYRNRLVRAYLGASNTRRQPNFFTGFDVGRDSGPAAEQRPGDNIRLQDLQGLRPLPVINMALNLVNGGPLAWQERKAESFTATPLHCGSADLHAYRPTDKYGGTRGISLGTAVATSGAAANPNMGYHSSSAVGFVMTLFNARLGTWLGNPVWRKYDRSGPRMGSWFYLLCEAFGWTNDRRLYVNLSDGGHFDNLGLYEMVRRRCRFIVVSDASQDADCHFDDLGGAIRKIRTDFGIPIDFGASGIQIYPKSAPKGQRKFYCAVGKIHYADVDGEGIEPGTIVYIKPTLLETEPYDLFNYARSSKDFPHETTVDQWFSETQFESYRALGKTAVLTMLGDESLAGGFDAMTAAIRRHLGPPPPQAGGGAAVTPSDGEGTGVHVT